MQPILRSLALVLPVSLAAAAFLGTKAPQTVVAAEPEPGGSDARETPYDHTAIGVVIRANYGRVPGSGSELVRALKKVGNFAQLPIPFSAVNVSSGITTPRVIIAPRPGGKSAAEVEVPDGKAGVAGLPGFPAFPGANPNPFGPRAKPSPLNPAAATEPNIEGRLFFAANMEKQNGTYRVKTIEFISWNSRNKRFDFGVIECGPAQGDLQMLDGVRCFSCHKNRGPILGQGPWSNTTHNDIVRAMALQALATNPAQVPGRVPKFPRIPRNPPPAAGPLPPAAGPLPTGFPRLTEQQIEATTFDGISLVHPEPEVCDAACRQGGDMARDRDIYRAMTKTADGRKALVVLMAAIASPGPIEQNSQNARRAVDMAYNITSAQFANDVVNISKSSANMLVDFSPSGSMGTLRTIRTNEPAAWGGGSTQRTDIRLTWGGDPDTITEYEQKRSNGEPGIPSQRSPSNPRAFVKPPVTVPPRPSAAANPVGLARMIGLTEGDRTFLVEQLTELQQRMTKKVSPSTLAKDVFTAPSFMDRFRAGDIPDREEFKDRFVSAVAEVAKANKVTGITQPDRKVYASGPSGAVGPGQEEKEIAIVPTTACLRCHDVQGVGKPAFNPIPKLAFDPFDAKARQTWVNNTDEKRRTPVLSRMLKRIHDDKDMPPEDAPEYDKYRVKDQASFDALKDWLEAELKKAGN